MQPVNYASRKSATNKFLALYGFSLIAVIAGVYFLFNTPAGIFKTELRKYGFMEAENFRVLGKLDTMTILKQEIEQKDSAFLADQNSDRQKVIDSVGLAKSQVKLNYAIQNIISDSSSLSNFNQEHLRNYITSFNEILLYMNLYESKQNILNNKDGINTGLLGALQSSQDSNKILRAQLSSIPKSQSPAIATINSAGPSDNSKQVDQLTTQLNACKDELQKCKAASQQSNTSVTTIPEAPGKPDILFKEGKALHINSGTTKFYGGNVEKRGMLDAAVRLLKDALALYSDKASQDLVQKDIDEVNKEISKTY